MKQSIVWMVACVAVCIPSIGFANMAGTQFTQTFSARTGMSKVKITRKLTKGAIDRDAFWRLDVCSPSLANFNIVIVIDNATDSFEKDIMSIPNDWDRSHCLAAFGSSNKDKVFLDTGDCKIKYSVKYTPDPGLSTGALSIKCVFPFAVAPIQDAVVYFDDSPSNVLNINESICFFPTPPGAAVVKKDGSNGRSVKMLATPADACEVH